MIRRFAGRLHAVVAGVAAAGHRGVIHERDGVPRGRNMTVSALLRGCNVPGWLERRANNAARRVAAGAGRCSRPECGGRVARLAAYIDMCAVQNKTGAKVIKCCFLANGWPR